ncbi:archaellin/type IV pilin N-terminal domain-containing protein [Halorubrum vacuolatum]|uniref:Flagellin n=1 Tax=Halorubrum vacuolatum TaxID=63740 RepID=A0A238WFJ2_HALVU|nr:archaellin/type IV pilin N-terminal domain-containing protein [Halorubrum vacuolatum]SNR45053.1 flagellin FlaB [Halorubrum vacuolatum]
MFEFITEEERGQVGIGTLIVFIAMVLVAAIAAGVLINTAGFLQTQAEATGEESASQVSDRLEVQSATGIVTEGTFDSGDFEAVDGSGEVGSGESPDTSVISQVSLTVTAAPGADDIDLDEVTAEMITDDGVNQVVLDQDGGDDEDITHISELGGNGDDNVLTDNGDRYIIDFDGANEGDMDDGAFEEGADDIAPDEGTWEGFLQGGDTMEVRLTTAAGATTVEEVRVPDSLIDRDAVSL